MDVLQIEQVVLNLVRNSIEAISDSGGTGGSIWIEARRADDDFIEVHVLIQDPASRASASKRDPCLCPLARPTDLVLGSRYVRRSWRRMEADFGWSHFRAAHPSTLRYRPQT